MKDGKDNSIDAAITEETKRVVSECSKNDTDKKCTSCEQNNIDNITKVEKVTILSDIPTNFLTLTICQGTLASTHKP